MSDELLLAQPEPPLATGMFGEGAIDSLPGPVVNALIGCIRGLGLPPRLASAYLISAHRHWAVVDLEDGPALESTHCLKHQQ
jgi:hypothetical protein